jgi:hypothetical protein
VKQASAVLRALADLPPTLDVTYDRILCRIPPESQQLARDALALCCEGFGPEPELLADAIRWTASEDPMPGDELLSVNSLFEFCICLLKKDVEGRVVLAHRTVRDYLLSPRIEHGPARHFHLSERDCNETYLTAEVNRLLSTRYLDDRTTASFRLWRCLTTNFASTLSVSADTIAANEQLYSKVLRLMDPVNGHIERILAALSGCVEDPSPRRAFRTGPYVHLWSYVPTLPPESPMRGDTASELVVCLGHFQAWPLVKNLLNNTTPLNK